MRRPVAMLLAVLAPLISGCDSSSFVPPPPPELATIPSPSTVPSVKVIEMVLRSEDTPDRTIWTQVARLDAGLARVSYRSSSPAAGDPPRKQAELIRKAAARGASALIVEPAPDPEVVEALDAVKASGTPVLLIARPLAGRESAFPLVVPGALAESARSMVKAVVEDAKAAKLPGDGTALILTPRQADVFTEDVVAAFKGALKEEGIASPEVLAYEGIQADASKALEARLQEDPKLTMVLAEGGDALFATLSTRDKIKDKRAIVAAGYAELGSHLNQSTLEQTAAIAERNVPKLAHEAFRLAVRMAEGRTIPERTEVPIPFHRYSSKPAPPPIPPPDRPASEVTK